MPTPQNINWIAGYNSIIEWSQLPSSRNEQLVRDLYVDHTEKLKRAAPDSDEWMREAGILEGLSRIYREHWGGSAPVVSAAAVPAAIAPAPLSNPVPDTRLSDALKSGAHIGPSESWRTSTDVVEAARRAARQDLAAKGLSNPSAFDIDKHARAKLQARINVNKKKFAGQQAPLWFRLMNEALVWMKAHRPAKPQLGAVAQHAFPSRKRWAKGAAALAAARRAARKRGATTRPEIDRVAEQLLGHLISLERGEANQAWYKSAVIAYQEIQKKNKQRAEKKSAKRTRKQNPAAASLPPRQENPSPAVVEQLAQEFVNGDKPAEKRIPISTKTVEVVVYPKEAYDVGILRAFEYAKERPGVDGSFFIHRLERKERPTVFIEKPGTIEIQPSSERWANRNGATEPVKVEIEGPAVPTRIVQDETDWADGGTVTALWIDIPKNAVDVDGEDVPFTIWELRFPRNALPTLDFTDGKVTMTFTREEWVALPPSQRVFWQYVGHRPTTQEGHGF